MYCLSGRIRCACLIELSKFEETDSAFLWNHIQDITVLPGGTRNILQRRKWTLFICCCLLTTSLYNNELSQWYHCKCVAIRNCTLTVGLRWSRCKVTWLPIVTLHDLRFHHVLSCSMASVIKTCDIFVLLISCLRWGTKPKFSAKMFQMERAYSVEKSICTYSAELGRWPCIPSF